MDRSGKDRLQPPARVQGEVGTEAGGSAFGGPGPDAAHRRMARLVRTLETEVIPRLVKAHRPAPPSVALPPVPWPDPEAFARLCHGPDDAPLHGVVQALRAQGVSVERLYIELIGPAARTLGQLWERDLCDFTDVTVGVGRLQQLLRELSPAFGTEVEHPQDGRRMLLLPAPGEQHTLGASMAAEFFRRAGWDVVGAVGGSSLDPVQAVQDEWFDILGLSAGHVARLDWLRDCVTRVRQVSRNRAIAVIVGGPLFTVAPQYGMDSGADAVVVDGQRGPEQAEALLARRGRRP